MLAACQVASAPYPWIAEGLAPRACRTRKRRATCGPELVNAATLKPVADTAAWLFATLPDGRVVAIVEVEPLSQTPCMTSDGQIFERVSSETRRVTDPTRVAELFARGQEARAAAEARAARVMDQMFAHPETQGYGKSVWVTVSMAAASYEPDIGSRLFHSRFREILSASVGAHAFADSGIQSGSFVPSWEIGQSYIDFLLAAENLGFLVRGAWDGSAAMTGCIGGDLVATFAMMDFVLVPAWRTAADIVSALGGYGDSRVQIGVRVVQTGGKQRTDATLDMRELDRLTPGAPPPRATLYGKLPASTAITRWSSVRGPTQEEIGSVQRELQRAAGLWSFEGAPDSLDAAS